MDMMDEIRLQPHTFTGARGDTFLSVHNAPHTDQLTYRDVYEAVLVGFNRAAGQSDDADVYGINLTRVDPVAAAQNTCIVLEQRAGIFPNIEKGSGIDG